MKKKEIIFIAVILLLAGGLWLGMQLKKPENVKSVTIRVMGEEFGTYSLQENQVIEIGGTNIAEIKDGQICMIAADCPDKLCIYQGPFGEHGGMIVCLPNEVLILGEDVTAGSGMDAVVK